MIDKERERIENTLLWLEGRITRLEARVTALSFFSLTAAIAIAYIFSVMP